jgi:hypothetical protein
VNSIHRGCRKVFNITLTHTTRHSATFFLLRFFRVLEFSAKDGGIGPEDLAVDNLTEADALFAPGTSCIEKKLLVFVEILTVYLVQ